MPQNEQPRSFELGLVMAGAASGGAYTAGAVDFLVQALDTWEKQKAEHTTGVPVDSVNIRIMSGASAGAMTSAIAAVAFGSEVTPVAEVARRLAAYLDSQRTRSSQGKSLCRLISGRTDPSPPRSRRHPVV